VKLILTFSIIIIVKLERTPAKSVAGNDRVSGGSEGELYFLSLARDRLTLSSYTDDRIRKNIEKWTDDMPALV
jgi:hypothetical protein